MLILYVPALLVAFLITVLEMTEVVALVFALGVEGGSIRHGALGATSGTAAISLIALGFGAALVAVPHKYLLSASALLLLAFGGFLFRSTLRSYRRAAAQRSGVPPSVSAHRVVQFAGGFTVGAIETTEAVVVLLALTAAGYGSSALLGAVAGGSALVVAAALVHERIRKIKVPSLKLGATSVLLAFAVFWAGEALGVAWPGNDLILLPLVVLWLAVVRGGVALGMRPGAGVGAGG